MVRKISRQVESVLWRKWCCYFTPGKPEVSRSCRVGRRGPRRWSRARTYSGANRTLMWRSCHPSCCRTPTFNLLLPWWGLESVPLLWMWPWAPANCYLWRNHYWFSRKWRSMVFLVIILLYKTSIINIQIFTFQIMMTEFLKKASCRTIFEVSWSSCFPRNKWDGPFIIYIPVQNHYQLTRHNNFQVVTNSRLFLTSAMTRCPKSHL